jgi:uncharacterized protein (TIGR03435 family)
VSNVFMWTRAATAAIASWAVSTAVLVAAQRPAEFDVASVKRNTSGEAGATLDLSRGQLRAVNTPLLFLIRVAFEVMDTQIVGAPGWAATERYDVLARAPEGMTSGDSMRPLTRTLLAERFKLATHREQREMPVFALVRARTDGRFGPGFREGNVDCAAANAAPAPPSPTPPGSQDEWPSCVVRFTPGLLYVGGYPMPEVLRMLTPLVGRTILDETGIAARVHIRLSFRPEARAAQPPDAVADDRPDLFTALEEQTGLKLESRRAAVDVLVVDSLERPTPD